MRKCTTENLHSLLSAIAEKRTLYLPTDGTDGRAHYTRMDENSVLSEKINTVRSAKDFFFPQTENLMEFKLTGKTIELKDIREETDEFVIFGVRACDTKSFEILDRVFLSEPVDSFYASRREHGIIITIACDRPAETCFCTAFGINPAEPRGDISCWRSENAFFFNANTAKGELLLSEVDAFTELCSDNAADDVKKIISERIEALPLKNLPLDKFGAGKTESFFNDPAWSELSESCLGCGTCTYVCPTCQCYDIKDFDTGSGIRRFRCWDSCMYSEFTKMSAGQSRPTQKERFRQRFMHKLVYFPENNDGEFSCVGCGRCLARCPISMNIVKVIKKLGGNADE